ncbi:MAG: hypothetical protein AB8H86_03830 [Polyangiales bacterium]
MTFIAEDFVAGRSLAAALSDAALWLLTPQERDVLWRYFEDKCRSRVMCESEKGIDGRIIDGSADVWNAEEFGPWIFESPLTVVCGALRFEATAREDAALRIARSARVFVHSLYAGRLHVEGELHVLGVLDVLELERGPGAFISDI